MKKKEVILLKAKNPDALMHAISIRHTQINNVIEIDISNTAELAKLAGVAADTSSEELYDALKQRFGIFSAWPEDAENLRQPSYKEEELAVPA